MEAFIVTDVKKKKQNPTTKKTQENQLKDKPLLGQQNPPNYSYTQPLLVRKRALSLLSFPAAPIS